MAGQILTMRAFGAPVNSRVPLSFLVWAVVTAPTVDRGVVRARTVLLDEAGLFAAVSKAALVD
jgi:hypothetical protein